MYSRYCTVQYEKYKKASKVQYCTVQYCTVQYSTVLGGSKFFFWILQKSEFSLICRRGARREEARVGGATQSLTTPGRLARPLPVATRARSEPGAATRTRLPARLPAPPCGPASPTARPWRRRPRPRRRREPLLATLSSAGCKASLRPCRQRCHLEEGLLASLLVMSLFVSPAP